VHRERLERYRASAGEAVESLLAVARLGYEEGELGILELLDAVRQSLDGRLKELELAASARRAAIELDRVVGLEIRP
jgi:outer membrane protein TolC